MENITNEFITILNYLLPGFVSTFLFYYPLTSFPKKSTFEMVVTALICTVSINLLMIPCGWLLIFIGTHSFSFGEWEPVGREFWSLLFAVVIGLLVTYWKNNDILNRRYREHKITKQSSYPSEWYGTFSETMSYVVLHFDDGKRLMGWPLEWPLSPKSGHFILEDASWLSDSGEIKLSNVTKIMVDTTSIVMVEFINSSTEVKDE